MTPVSVLEKFPFYQPQSNLNPFDIYIILPVDDLEEERIRGIFLNMWEKLTFLPAIFKINFLKENNISDDDPKLLKIIGKSNIFARVLGPEEPFRIELGNFEFNNKNEEEIELETYLFILQLCQSDLSMVRNYISTLLFKQENVSDNNKKIDYLKKIEDIFVRIQDYLKSKLKIEYLSRLRKEGENDLVINSHERLQYINLPIIGELAEKGNLGKIENLAKAVGLDVPVNDKTIDPDIIIKIKEEVDESIFPGLEISKKSKSAIAKTGYREGIFLYTCTLLYKIEGREFRKKDFVNFLIELTCFKEKEEFRYKEMPLSLKEKFNWYKSVYNALFKRSRNSFKHEETYYKGRMSFEEWCFELLNKIEKKGNSFRFRSDRDSLKLGISRVRANIRNSLKKKGLNDISSKVDLDATIGVKDKPYKLYIKEENIKFPRNARWKKLVNDESHLYDETKE